MKLYYNTGIFASQLLVKGFSLVNEKAKLLSEGRKSIYSNIPNSWKQDNRKTAHFHAASLGEFEQARPVIERFRIEFPDYKILLTFFSPSGYEIRKYYNQADYVCYLPFDTEFEANKFTKVFNPAISFFVKYEFWYHICKALHQNGTTLISFSAIFRQNQSLFKWYGKDIRSTLRLFDYFFVQNELSKKLLSGIHITATKITGDTRFDRVAAICKKPKELPEIEAYVDNKPCFVIGSSWKEDIEIIAPFINAFKQPLKIIIAPHNINEDDISYLEQAFKKKTIRYSNINKYTDEKILLIDNMGMLSSVYQFATICHIGGAFKTGLHNTLEAATYGKPILIGPNYKKFDEAIALVNLDVCFPIQSTEQYESKFISLYENKQQRTQIAETLKTYIDNNLGASEAVIDYCIKNLKHITQ